MKTGHGNLALAALTLSWAASGCDTIDRTRSRFGTTDTLTVEGAARGSGLMLGLQAPGTLRAGEEGVVRLSVTNRADTTAADIRLELIVPSWVEPMSPRPDDPEVSMVALAGGGTRFAYRVRESPLEPGQTESIDQRIRVPAAGTPRPPNATWPNIVRARLLGRDGKALAEVEAEIALDSAATPDTTRASAAEIANRRDEIGPVRLGMTRAALRRAVPSARDTSWRQEGTSQPGAWVGLSSGGRFLAVLSGDSVVRLEVRDRAVRTRERLGVGSRLEELRTAYGAACAETGEGAVVVWFANAPGISFALDTPTPASVAQLRDHPDRLPGQARVERWWLRRGVDSCTR